MFKPSVTFLLAILLCSAGCDSDKDTNVVKDFRNNKATLSLGSSNLTFTVDAGVSFNNNSNLDIQFTYKENGVERLEFLLSNIPNAVGTYQVFPWSATDNRPTCLFATSSGDVLNDNYLLLESANNAVTITKVDQEKEEVSGTFDLTLVFDDTKGAKQDNYPDTLVIQNGSFFAVIRD
jgi:hypothetical protein